MTVADLIKTGDLDQLKLVVSASDEFLGSVDQLMPFKPGQSGNTAGRPPGIRDRRTRSLDQAMAAIGARIVGQPDGEQLDAHTLLVRVYQEPELPIELRVLAARAALKVERPALSAVAMSGDLTHHVSIADQLARARRREIGQSGPIIDCDTAEIVVAAAQVGA